jgi:hypothetical protein
MVGLHDHHSICYKFRAFVSVLQPSVAGTRACDLAASADRLGRQRPRRLRSLLPASFRRPAPMGRLYRVWPRVLDASALAKPGMVMKWHRKGLSDLFAVAITLSWAP